MSFFFANLWWATTFYFKKCQNVPKCFVWTLQSDFLFENIAKDKIVERQTFVQKSCERESIWLISNSRLALTDLKSIFLSWKLTTTTTTKKIHQKIISKIFKKFDQSWFVCEVRRRWAQGGNNHSKVLTYFFLCAAVRQNVNLKILPFLRYWANVNFFPTKLMFKNIHPVYSAGNT